MRLYERPIKSFLIFTLYTVITVLVYNAFIANDAVFPFFWPIKMSIEYVLRILLSLLIFSALWPAKSSIFDIFVKVYLFFVVLSFSIYHPGSVSQNNLGYFLSLINLTWPAICIRFLKIPLLSFRFTIKNFMKKFQVSQSIYIIIMSFILLYLTLVLLYWAPDNAGFGIGAEHYERRLAAREIFIPRSFHAYLIMFVTNGLIPFSVFYLTHARKYLPLIFPLLAGVALFYALGLKAQFIYIAFAIFFGIMVKVSLEKALKYFGIGIFCLLLVGFIESYFFHGNIIVGKIIRRLFFMPAYTIGKYFHYLSTSDWQIFSGVGSDISITYLIGKVYFGNENANENTNTFLLYLTKYGIWGYSAAIAIVYITLTLLENIKTKYNSNLLLFLSFQFSFLLLEQDVKSTLFSSGILVLTMSLLFLEQNISTEANDSA